MRSALKCRRVAIPAVGRLWLAFLLLVSALPAQIQMASADKPVPLKNLSLEELGNIEVTSQKKEPEKIWRSSSSIFVITQEDIRRSGVTSIADALRLAPGVEVARMTSTSYAIGIRGLQSNFSKSVLVLIDGRSVYTPLFSGVYWDVQDIVLDNIERIEVIRGPGGTIWGPNAVNGIINIITKHTSDTQGAYLNTVLGNVDRIGEVRYGGKNGRFSYRIWGKGFYREHQFHQDNRNYDNWHQGRAGFRGDFERGQDSFTFNMAGYGGNSPHEVGTTIADDSVSGGHVRAGWKRNLGNGSDIAVHAYFDRTIRIGNQLGETRNTWDVDAIHHVNAGDRHDIIYGVGLRWSPTRFIQKQPSINVLPNDLLEHTHTLFAQDEIQLVKGVLSFTAGVKLQNNNFTGWDAQPTGRLLWTPRERQTFWAAITRAVTTPSRIETGFFLSGRVSPALELRVVGRPDFKSEAMIGYEAGYRQLFGKNFSLDLSLFRNAYQDIQSFGASQVTFENTPPPPHTVITIPYMNDIAGTGTGMELAADWKPLDFWRLNGSYSFVGLDLHANAATSDISSTGSVRTYEGSTPRHQTVIRSSFDLPKNFSFDQFFRASSALPAQNVRAYSTMDLNLGWSYRDRFRIAVVGQNLFQPQHQEWGTGDPGQLNLGIRRAAYVRLTWTSQ